jgi:enoyl-CoA hydratase
LAPSPTRSQLSRRGADCALLEEDIHRMTKRDAAAAGEPLGFAEALALLDSPFAGEAYTVLGAQPFLLVDLADWDAHAEAATHAPSEALRAPLQQRIAELPCPALALAPKEPSDFATRMLAHFDLVAHDAGELAPVLESIRRWPLASLALVQLLRHNEALDIHQGLIAESLTYSTLQSGPEFHSWLAQRGPARSRAVADAGPAVRVERRDDRLELTLNRPSKRNAFSLAMRDALAAGLQLLCSDASLRSARLSGAGPAFCSGGDLDEFGSLPDPATAHAVRATRNVGRLLAACAERVEVRVHGACVGAGVELPCFAKRVVAKPDAYFQLPELGLGLVPGAGGSVSLPRRIGRQRTAYLALSRERIDVTTALAWGLVDAIEE